jgi:hypothetical protein
MRGGFLPFFPLGCITNSIRLVITTKEGKHEVEAGQQEHPLCNRGLIAQAIRKSEIPYACTYRRRALIHPASDKLIRWILARKFVENSLSLRDAMTLAVRVASYIRVAYILKLFVW